MAYKDTGSDEDLVSWINSCLVEAKNHSAQWRQEARLCYDFRAGRQWSETDRAQLEEQKKVPVVFNRVERTVNAVIGLEIQNRQAVRYVPREMGDAKVNEVFTAAADWIRDQCNAEDEESDAFSDLVTCGMGWTETRMEYDEDPDGLLNIDRIDPLDCFWDATARKRNISDSRWLARVKRVSNTDIRELWPDYTEVDGKAGESFLDDEDSPHVTDRNRSYEKDEPSANQPKNKELVCFQWWEREKFHRIQLADGRIQEFDNERWKKVKKAVLAEPMVTNHIEQNRKRYYHAYTVGGELLEKRPLAVQAGFTLKCITGGRDRNHNTWFGLVMLMIDPQRWANKWLSQIMHILNNSAKGGVMAETSAFANPKMAEQTWAKAEAITWTNPGAISGNQIAPKPQTPMPEGYAQLLEFAVNSINDVPGVNMELMGLVGRSQAGVLEDMRKKAGITVLSVFFDAIRLYRKEQGRIMAAFITEYMSDGRLIRIVGQEGAQYVPLVRQEGAARYDVVVDESATSPNMKERVFSMLTQLAPFLAKAGVPLPPDVLEYSPLPAALVEKWKAFMEQNKQLPPQAQQMIQQLQQAVQGQGQQIQKLHDENLTLKTDGQIEVYKANKSAEVDIHTAKIKAETETEKRSVEIYRANLDAMMEKMTILSEAMMNNIRMASEAYIPKNDQVIESLGSSIMPVFQQLMQTSIGQTEQLQQLGPALQSMGEAIVAGINKGFADNRLVGSEPVYDPKTSRLKAIKRRFGNGEMDELPYAPRMMQ